MSKIPTLLIPIAVFIFANVAESAPAKLSVNTMFTDNAVLQRGIVVPVWGEATPGSDVTVEFNGQAKKTKASAKGKWMTKLDPMKAGGPYELRVSGEGTITMKNIMVGEVWICSGQSNMEQGIGLSNNAGAEKKAANYPNIRLFMINNTTSPTPRDRVSNAQWRVCSPKTIGMGGWLGFSAVGYYFGRDLHKSLNVPIGLIDSNWGGTPAEAWTEETALAKNPDFAVGIRYWKRIREYNSKTSKAEIEKLHQKRVKHWESLANVRAKGGFVHVDTGNTKVKAGWARNDFDDGSWKEMTLPCNWENSAETGMALADLDGAVWFRKAVDVSAAEVGKAVELSLGAIDDFDTTYFNGVKVGSTGEKTPNYWQFKRLYTVPANLVKAGKNTIAIRVFDNVGGGGIQGPFTKMKITFASGKAASLTGKWKYAIEKTYDPFVLKNSRRPTLQPKLRLQNAPTYLYNGMIAPIVPYAVRGAIWYQGESNAGRADQYYDLLPTMIRSWRKAWGQDRFAFHIVSLAAYGPARPRPVDDSWATVRHAQYLTAKKDPQNGLAITIDIGSARDIHPRNKQDVGKRLCLAARAITYGQDIVYSGPEYKSMKVEGNKARLSFDHVGGGLVAKGGELKRFAIAGEDATFVWAKATIDGKDIVVWSDAVKSPVAVRYAWETNPDGANLYNKEGLPAIPFATDK